MTTPVPPRTPAELAALRTTLADQLTTHAVERRRVTLASGRSSEFYIDCRPVLLTPQGMAAAGTLVADAVLRLTDVRALGGPVLGGVLVALPAVLAARAWGATLHAFAVRPEPKEHGRRRRVELAAGLRPGTPVALVEDVVTTGGSVLGAAAACREAGLVPRAVVALVDRGEGGRQAIEAQGLAFASVFEAAELLHPGEPGGGGNPQ